MDILCILHEHNGMVSWPVTAYARFWGISDQQASEILDELASTRVANVEWQSDDKIIANLSNRRMVREFKKSNETSEVRAEAGRAGAAARWQKCASSSSTSSSYSSSHTLTDTYAHFDEFWNAYPKKKNKGDAEKAWKVIRPTRELVTKMLASLQVAKQSADWLKDNGQFIPYPASWLRAKGWEDEPVVKREQRQGAWGRKL